MTQRNISLEARPRHIALVIIIAVSLYVLLPQIGSFRSSWQLLRHREASGTAAAIALTFGTYLAGTGTYCLLAFRSLRYWRTVLVQFAAMFVNRLLPAGIGALGANYLYLRHEKHTASQAVTVVAVNNLLGFAGHGVVLLTALSLTSDSSVTQPVHHGGGHAAAIEFAAIAGLIVLFLALIAGRRRAAAALNDLRTQLFSYRHRPLHLLGALGTSMILTLCNVSALYFCLQALGLHLAFAAVLLVFTFGVGAGAAVPTPGGLGGFEAGLAAGFVAYGIDSGSALAAALLYRLISYWLPLLTGLGALIICQKRRVFGDSLSL